MSADDISEQAQRRLRRLKAMQSRHEQGQAPPEAAQQAPRPGAGLLAGLQGGGQEGGQGNAPGGMLQRLRKALSGPDGTIDPQKARAFLMFVRKQAADPQAPRHQLAKRIADKLKALPQQQRQRLLAAAGLGGGALGAGAARHAAAPGTAPAQGEGAGEAWLEDLVGKL